jgi:hypothetical protein
MKRGEFNKRGPGVNERSPKSQNPLHQKQKVVFGGHWKAPKNRVFNLKTETDFEQKQTKSTEKSLEPEN